MEKEIRSANRYSYIHDGMYPRDSRKTARKAISFFPLSYVHIRRLHPEEDEVAHMWGIYGTSSEGEISHFFNVKKKLHW